MGSEAVRQLTSQDEDDEQHPIFQQLMDTPIGGDLNMLSTIDLSWVYADWEPWVYDPQLLWEPPSLTMGEAVHLIADRIQALTTPTAAWPLALPTSDMQVVS